METIARNREAILFGGSNMFYLLQAIRLSGKHSS